MTKKEWQEHYGFSDDDMYNISGWLFYYNGTITNIFEKHVDIVCNHSVYYNHRLEVKGICQQFQKGK